MNTHNLRKPRVILFLVIAAVAFAASDTSTKILSKTTDFIVGINTATSSSTFDNKPFVKKSRRKLAALVGCHALMTVNMRYGKDNPWIVTFDIIFSETTGAFSGDFCRSFRPGNWLAIEERNIERNHPASVKNLEHIAQFYGAYPATPQSFLAYELLLTKYLQNEKDNASKIARTRIELAKTYFKANNNEEALAYLDMVLEDVENGDFGNNLLYTIYDVRSRIYISMSETDLASADIERYAETFSDSDDQCSQLSIAKRYVQAGNILKAKEIYVATIMNSSKCYSTEIKEEALFELAKIETELGDVAHAEELYLEAVTMTVEKNYIYLEGLAGIYEDQGRYTEAIEALEKTLPIFTEMGGVADEQKAEMEIRIERLRG